MWAWCATCGAGVQTWTVHLPWVQSTPQQLLLSFCSIAMRRICAQSLCWGSIIVYIELHLPGLRLLRRTCHHCACKSEWKHKPDFFTWLFVVVWCFVDAGCINSRTMASMGSLRTVEGSRLFGRHSLMTFASVPGLIEPNFVCVGDMAWLLTDYHLWSACFAANTITRSPCCPRIQTATKSIANRKKTRQSYLSIYRRVWMISPTLTQQKNSS